MFSYKINSSARGPIVQIFDGPTTIDECGPWESEASALNWASSFVNFKQTGGQEPTLPVEEESTMDTSDSGLSEGEV